MKITILHLSKSTSANPMKALLILSKYLKLGMQEAKDIVNSFPTDLNIGTLSAPMQKELTASLLSCGILAVEKPLPILSCKDFELLSYIRDLCFLESQIMLCQGIFRNKSAEVFHILYSSQLDFTKTTLSKLYSLNVIAIKYRHPIPVFQFLDYLEDGRCTQLEGEMEAYSLYESELMHQKITNLMNRITLHYEDLSNTQYHLFLAMQEAKAAETSKVTEEQTLNRIQKMKTDTQNILDKYGLS